MAFNDNAQGAAGQNAATVARTDTVHKAPGATDYTAKVKREAEAALAPQARMSERDRSAWNYDKINQLADNHNRLVSAHYSLVKQVSIIDQTLSDVIDYVDDLWTAAVENDWDLGTVEVPSAVEEAVASPRPRRGRTPEVVTDE